MKSACVLIVDDNVDFAFSLGEILGDEGYQTVCTHSGEEALEKFRQQDFDIVLLDMKLPRVSGAEVLLELRKIKPGINVLMMSGHSVIDLLAQATDGGIHRIFYPPYKLDSLLGTLYDMQGEGLLLVVDDQAGLADNVRQRLSQEGKSVILATQAPEAIEKTSANKADYLLLDLRQPIVRGLEVYWALKQEGRTLPTVIIAPGPKESYVTIERLNRFPVCGYFIKPFDPFELLPALEAIVE